MKKNALASLSVLAILVATGLTWHQLYSRPRPDFTLDDAVGRITAEEAARLVRKPGEVVIITQETERSFNEALDRQVKAFEQALAKSSSLPAPKKETIPQPPMNAGLSNDQWDTIRQAHPNAVAFVSFMGFPVIPPPRAGSAASRPALIAIFNSPSMQAPDELRRQRSLDLAVVAKSEPAETTSAQAKDARAQFEAAYSLSKAP